MLTAQKTGWKLPGEGSSVLVLTEYLVLFSGELKDFHFNLIYIPQTK